MATAYVFEVVTRCQAPKVHLWLPTDPIPDSLIGPEGNRGIFEALYGSRGEPAGTGTWVGVTGLSFGYDTVALDLPHCAGIAALSSPLHPSPHQGRGAHFGITLRPGFVDRHVLSVVFGMSGKGKPARLVGRRELDVMRLTIPAPAPVGSPVHSCRGELVAELAHVPHAVMAALAAGKETALVLAPACRGITRLGKFTPTGAASGSLEFVVEETPDGVHQLALTARCPEDGRTLSAVAPAFLFEARPRIELRGPAAARAVPADPPALFRIGPFDGLAPGECDVVHAAFGDLRRWKQPYKGPPWTFQLRVQPYRRADGTVNDAVPQVRSGQLELTEGGDLGVIVAADSAHPRFTCALVEHGKVQARLPLLRTGNPFMPADGTFPEIAVSLRGAGIERQVQLPDRAILFFLDEFELTNVCDGLLRTIDNSSDHCGTALIMALHALAPCGCVSRLELSASASEPLSIVGGLRMQKAHA